jgi:hypothetical protein
MCDYSTDHVASRPARVGDILVTKSFFKLSTRGFADAGEPNVAVCLLPGTELAFEKHVKWDRTTFPFWRRARMGKLVRFRQIDVNTPGTHHDAVEFPNGRVVLVTTLSEGQTARVLQLPARSQELQRARYSEKIEAAADPRVIDLVPTRGRDSWELIYDPWADL